MAWYLALNEKEREQLLKFPAYVSLLASTMEEGMDQREKNIAVRLTHIKTFCGDPMLLDFYKDADKNFDATITTLNAELPHHSIERRRVIHRELRKLEGILKKIGPEYASVLHRSMQSYKNYISRAHRNVLEYLIFPLPIEGISD